MIPYYLGTLFTIAMMVECARRGQAWPWFWIMLLFNPLGAIAYFIIEVQPWVVLPGIGGSSSVAFRSHRVTALDLQRAEGDVRRLDNAAAWIDYAELLRARKRYREAADAATRALERQPDGLHARYERGRALLDLGEPAAAAIDLAEVVSREPQHDYGDALLALAKAHEAEGKLDQARACYARLAERSSRPDVLYQVGNILEITGDVDAALTTFQQIVDDADLSPAFQRRDSKPWIRRARAAIKRLNRAQAAGART